MTDRLTDTHQLACNDRETDKKTHTICNKTHRHLHNHMHAQPLNNDRHNDRKRAHRNFKRTGEIENTKHRCFYFCHKTNHSYVQLCNSRLQLLLLSRPDLRETFYFSIWLGQGVILGRAFYVVYFFVFGRVWFPIRGSCLSLSLIEDHTQAALFPTFCCGILSFCVACVCTTSFLFVELFFWWNI